MGHAGCLDVMLGKGGHLVVSQRCSYPKFDTHYRAVYLPSNLSVFAIACSLSILTRSDVASFATNMRLRILIRSHHGLPR
jgi:hypothetical protein